MAKVPCSLCQQPVEAVLFGWMGVNAWLLARHPFDPYPFILLNLVLSTVAALQAPVIMMSQNRQAAKDRMQATQDYGRSHTPRMRGPSPGPTSRPRSERRALSR